MPVRDPVRGGHVVEWTFGLAVVRFTCVRSCACVRVGVRGAYKSERR